MTLNANVHEHRFRKNNKGAESVAESCTSGVPTEASNGRSTSASGSGSRKNDLSSLSFFSGDDSFFSSDSQGKQPWTRETSEETIEEEPAEGLNINQSKADDNGTEASQARKFPSLSRQGPSFSVGSLDHPNGCKPCAFYCFSDSGCRDSDACTFCHLFHTSKLRQRRESWKKSRKTMYQERQETRRGRSYNDQSGSDEWQQGYRQNGRRKNKGAAESPWDSSYSMEAVGNKMAEVGAAVEPVTQPWLHSSPWAATPGVYDYQTQDPSRLGCLRSDGDGVLNEVLNTLVAHRLPTQSHQGLQPGAPSQQVAPTYIGPSFSQDIAADVQGRFPVRPSARSFPAAARAAPLIPGALVNSLELPVEYVHGMTGQMNGHACPPRLDASPDILEPNVLGALLRSMANVQSPYPADAALNSIPVPSATFDERRIAPPGVSGEGSIIADGQSFTYMPSEVTVAVGQQVDMWPQISSRVRLFAIAPELPRGLTLQTRTGRICGAPQEPVGQCPYFVTSCEPHANNNASRLQIAIVHINVIDVGSAGNAGGTSYQPILGDRMVAPHDGMHHFDTHLRSLLTTGGVNAPSQSPPLSQAQFAQLLSSHMAADRPCPPARSYDTHLGQLSDHLRHTVPTGSPLSHSQGNLSFVTELREQLTQSGPPQQETHAHQAIAAELQEQLMKMVVALQAAGMQ